MLIEYSSLYILLIKSGARISLSFSTKNPPGSENDCAVASTSFFTSFFAPLFLWFYLSIYNTQCSDIERCFTLTFLFWSYCAPASCLSFSSHSHISHFSFFFSSSVHTLWRWLGLLKKCLLLLTFSSRKWESLQRRGIGNSFIAQGTSFWLWYICFSSLSKSQNIKIKICAFFFPFLVAP